MPDTPEFSASPHAKRMVSDLTLGIEVSDLFIIASAQQGQARNGPYWRLDFRDSSGSIGGKLWSPLSQNFTDLASGMIAHVSGRVSSYRDKLELSIDAMRVLREEECAVLDISLFMPSSPYNPDRMMQELLERADEVLRHPAWLKLVRSILTDPDIASALRQAPAAKSMHHAYAGGLLEHTLSVVNVCMRLADHYPGLDRQVLFAGAVCHDLGKLWELSHGLSVEYTQAGKLLGHISLFMERLSPFIRDSGLEPELAEHLQHLVLSHHGTYEFGSPRLPSTGEALVLHYADVLDAKLQQVSNALANLEDEQWTPYMPALERSLFKAKKTPEAPAPSPSDPFGDLPSDLPDQDSQYENHPVPEPAMTAEPDFDESARPVDGSSHPDLETILAQDKDSAEPWRPFPPSADIPAASEQAEEPQEAGPGGKTGGASRSKTSQPLPLFSQCSLLSKE